MWLDIALKTEEEIEEEELDDAQDNETGQEIIIEEGSTNSDTGKPPGLWT